MNFGTKCLNHAYSKSKFFAFHRKYFTQILEQKKKHTHTKKTQMQTTAQDKRTRRPPGWIADCPAVYFCASSELQNTLSSDTKPLTRLHTNTHKHNPRSERGASYFRYLRFERIHQTDGSRWWLAIYQISSERCRAGEHTSAQAGNAHKRRFASCTYKACASARACCRGRSSVVVVMVARSRARARPGDGGDNRKLYSHAHKASCRLCVCVCPVLCVYVFVQFITTVFGRHKTRRRQIDAGHALELKTCSILHLIGHFHHQTGT